MTKYLVTKLITKVKTCVVDTENKAKAIEKAMKDNIWEEDRSASTLSENYIITQL